MSTNSPSPLPHVQVHPAHYRPRNYDELHRWISYWYQIQSVAQSGAQTVLEIGVGSGVLSTYLRHRLGLQVTTVDFDPALQPDLIADIRQLDQLVDPASFDAVVAFQVLEHLPFADFPVALQQMARASRRTVLLSLPHYGYDCQARVRLWKYTWAFSRKISKCPRWTFNGEHYWEIGTRGHPLRRVRAILRRVLAVQRDYFCPDYPYHYFFECQRLHNNSTLHPLNPIPPTPSSEP